MAIIDPSVTIGVFIDGGYLAKMNQTLFEQMGMNIDIRNLFSFLKQKSSQLYQVDLDDCHIVESHFFRGRFRADDADDKHLLYSERKFEDTLIENDVIFHYKHLRQVGGNAKQVIEKGIDVWFALEAYEQTLSRQFDIVVLMTGDADHEMLIKKLKSMKTRVVLLTWSVGEGSSTALLLKEEATKHLEISELVEQDPSLVQFLCKAVETEQTV